MWLSKILHALSGRPAAKAQEERTDPGSGTYVHNLRVLCDIVERQLLYPDPPTTPGQAIIPITLDPLTMDQLTKARAILQPGPTPIEWAAVDEAELRLFSIMPGGLLKVELATQVARAELLKVVGLGELKAQFVGSNPPLNEQGLRDLAVALLQRMYNRYDERRRDRGERRLVDVRMLYTTLCLFAAFLLMVTALIIAGISGFDPMGMADPDALPGTPVPLAIRAGRGIAFLAVIHLWVVPYFGMIGAMFSRFIEYRSKRVDLGTEDLWSGYSPYVTWGRLMIGALSALLFYFIVAGNLISGSMFFDTNLSFLMPGNGHMMSTFPNEGFFRLVIWSAIAGFAERLVPERFDELVNTSKAKEK